jgi:hypothetical protein
MTRLMPFEPLPASVLFGLSCVVIHDQGKRCGSGCERRESMTFISILSDNDDKPRDSQSHTDQANE